MPVRGEMCSENMAAFQLGESNGAGCVDLADGRFAIERFRRPSGSTGV